MKRTVVWLLTIAFAAPNHPASGQGPRPEAKPHPAMPAFDTDSYQLGLLRAGPNSGTGTKEEAETIQAGHTLNIGKMAQAGKLIAAGPMLDNGDLRGIFLFKAASLDEAKALVAEDPAIKARRLRLDLFTWTGPKGIGVKFNEEYRKNPDIAMTMTKYHFALLKRVGDAAMGSLPTDRKLMPDRLRNVRGRIDEGKMLAAGPLADAGDLVGIVVFATESMD